MADNLLKCKIINIDDDPNHLGRKIVSVRFDDGKGEPWVQGFSILQPETPLSPEQFFEDIKEHPTVAIKRPVDPFKFLNEVKQSGKVFEVDPTKVIQEPPKKVEKVKAEDD